MEFAHDVWHAVVDHPLEVAICIGFPVALAFLLGGDGTDFGGRGDDCDGDGGD
ncbi:MAG: hypothetical protein AAFR35_16210 [Pseudomonadota bacterium]